jgi:hypothetical protein
VNISQEEKRTTNHTNDTNKRQGETRKEEGGTKKV